jgi:hypothetical protein
VTPPPREQRDREQPRGGVGGGKKRSCGWRRRRLGSQCRGGRRGREEGYMGGGNGLVDGFRRLFHRRTPSGSVPGSNQSSAGDDFSSDIEVVEDLDLVGLRAIRVPKRKMPLPVETHKKVRQSRCSLCSWSC